MKFGDRKVTYPATSRRSYRQIKIEILIYIYTASAARGRMFLFDEITFSFRESKTQRKPFNRALASWWFQFALSQERSGINTRDIKSRDRESMQAMALDEITEKEREKEREEMRSIASADRRDH